MTEAIMNVVKEGGFSICETCNGEGEHGYFCGHETIAECDDCCGSGLVSIPGAELNAGPGKYVRVNWDEAYILWDKDNGSQQGNVGYIWVFPTKQDAEEHRKEQHSKKYNARLSGPMVVRRPGSR